MGKKIYLKKVSAHEGPYVCHDKNMNPCYFGSNIDGIGECKPMKEISEKFKCYDPSRVFIKVKEVEK